MSPVPHAATHPARRSAWARVLVLLLALLVPGTHAQAQALPATAVAGDLGGAGGSGSPGSPGGSGGSGSPGGGTAAEYDLLDTALRSPARTTRRPAAPRHPAPLLPPLPRAPRPLTARHPAPAPPPPPFPRSTRSVVLRC
ncbi:hypothetical protein J7I94_37175 [Streptomyces sp. ISL-12]|uniref:hypothetical protein n=1 Tax=Streptomyces sp. ISL-12 TaxID=2819177 RepID=UPI001BE70807|nr:hypothetical protein [Streptomyces sp. ISL-12]MBT2416092.1 hypothetical protein [Streptomyces sp. ISL-12]